MKIETIADKLLILVKKKKRMTFADCAKILKVPESLVEEWAEFLEDEGLIDVEYRLATPYLVEKAMSKSEEDDKIKSISKKRDFFVEKELESIELTESNLDIDNIKQTFQKVKDAVQIEIDALREELKEIKDIENSEKSFEKSTDEMRKYFLQKINAISKKMLDDEKDLDGISKKFKSESSDVHKAVVDMSSNLKNAANWIKYLKSKTEDQEKRLVKIEKLIKKKWK